MRHTPRPNEVYRHFKGNSYKIITLAKDSESDRDVVVYQALYGDFQVYVRSLEGFMSRVDKKKYPDAKQEDRFMLVTDIIDPISHPSEDIDTLSSVNENVQQNMDTDTGIRDKAGNASASAVFHTESSQKEDADLEGTADLDPLLLKFLEDKTYKEKLNDLCDMHKRITDDMINTMAASLEVEVAEGDLETRYLELKRCLLTFEKYECSRLR